jgi:hypothetical protein
LIPEIDIWRAAQLMLKRYGDYYWAARGIDERPVRADRIGALGATCGSLMLGWSTALIFAAISRAVDRGRA